MQLDHIHSQQSTSLSLASSTPTMEVGMLVHSIEKIVSVRYLLTIVLLTVVLIVLLQTEMHECDWWKPHRVHVIVLISDQPYLSNSGKS